jgi:hypothetical protein
MFNSFLFHICFRLSPRDIVYFVEANQLKDMVISLVQCYF